MNVDLLEQENELLALYSIFSPEEFVREEPKCVGEIRVSVDLPKDFSVVQRKGDELRQYEISFLPPLLLTFELPDDYPSSSPPSFTLTCSWLTHTQLSALSNHLVDLYQATGGTVVLFSWAQFLREEALSFLDIHSRLELPSDEHNTLNSESAQNKNSASVSEADQHSVGSTGDQNLPVLEPHEADDVSPSSDSLVLSGQSGQTGAEQAASLPDLRRSLEKDQAVSRFSLDTTQTLLSQLLVYNEAQKQKTFATTLFDCSVCFVPWLGSECVQLRECGHVYCQSCLAQLCKVQIEEGNVRGVTCPQSDCSATPTPAQVRSLVGEELFSRYDRLLLQSTLDRMPDVVYCPRRSCGCAVILDPGSRAAQCSVCSFAFCVVCNKIYHGTDDCQTWKTKKKQGDREKREAYLAIPDTEAGLTALWEDYESGSKQRRDLLESRYGRHRLQTTVVECLNEEWMTNNSKQCPHCYCKIEKNGGCNSMSCTHCGQRFCWACLTRLPFSKDVFRHFQNSACSAYTY